MATRRSFECPHCGADVPGRALACPECGSDAESGWSDDADAWAGDLPTGHGEEDEFDYEDALRAEGLLRDGRPSRALVLRRRIALICLVLALGMLAYLLLPLFRPH
ncbi:MAG: TFIIB-type zinc ribbon-containing protein [Planctomycetota bacterium]|jgi:hypothetical protein